VTVEREPASKEIAVAAAEDRNLGAPTPESADHTLSIVELLRDGPDSTSSLATILGEHAELEQLLAAEPVSPMARAIIGRLIEHQNAEREAFLSALRVYQEETSRLSHETTLARAELARQIDAARLEREHLLAEFLDRLDQLSAKISTSAARYTAQLAEKEILQRDAEKRAEVYAGHAANAQKIVADMRRSSSWRITAPMRLLSRMLARRTSTTSAKPGD
jgi:hypothetical protein